MAGPRPRLQRNIRTKLLSSAASGTRAQRRASSLRAARAEVCTDHPGRFPDGHAPEEEVLPKTSGPNRGTSGSGCRGSWWRSSSGADEYSGFAGCRVRVLRAGDRVPVEGPGEPAPWDQARKRSPSVDRRGDRSDVGRGAWKRAHGGPSSVHRLHRGPDPWAPGTVTTAGPGQSAASSRRRDPVGGEGDAGRGPEAWPLGAVATSRLSPRSRSAPRRRARSRQAEQAGRRAADGHLPDGGKPPDGGRSPSAIGRVRDRPAGRPRGGGPTSDAPRADAGVDEARGRGGEADPDHRGRAGGADHALRRTPRRVRVRSKAAPGCRWRRRGRPGAERSARPSPRPGPFPRRPARPRRTPPPR